MLKSYSTDVSSLENKKENNFKKLLNLESEYVFINSLFGNMNNEVNS